MKRMAADSIIPVLPLIITFPIKSMVIAYFPC